MQLHERTKPTFYRIVEAGTKELIATAPASKVLTLRAKLARETGKTLEIELIEAGT